MTEAVFYARPDGVGKVVQRATGVAVKTQSRQPGAAAVSAVNAACSLAVKDQIGDVQPRSCEGHVYKFHPTRNIVRADRGDFGPVPVPTLISSQSAGGTAVSGWAARIEGPGTDGPAVVVSPAKGD